MVLLPTHNPAAASLGIHHRQFRHHIGPVPKQCQNNHFWPHIRDSGTHTAWQGCHLPSDSAWAGKGHADFDICLFVQLLGFLSLPSATSPVPALLLPGQQTQPAQRSYFLSFLAPQRNVACPGRPPSQSTWAATPYLVPKTWSSCIQSAAPVAQGQGFIETTALEKNMRPSPSFSLQIQHTTARFCHFFSPYLLPETRASCLQAPGSPIGDCFSGIVHGINRNIHLLLSSIPTTNYKKATGFRVFLPFHFRHTRSPCSSKLGSLNPGVESPGSLRPTLKVMNLTCLNLFTFWIQDKVPRNARAGPFLSSICVELSPSAQLPGWPPA